MEFTPIGRVLSPHKDPVGAPIQPRFAEGAEGRVEIAPEYREALADLLGFERVWLIYAFDAAQPWRPKVTPFRDTQPRGLFATRAPLRPNPIGMSTVRLLGVDDSGLRVGELDVLDGTLVLDIKPYVPLFDAYPEAKAGWLEANTNARRAADERFS